MRLTLILLALAACLVGCGGNLPDLGCVLAERSCVAWYGGSNITGYMETDGKDRWTAGVTEGTDWKCVEIVEWSKEEWCAAREKLGVPSEVCPAHIATGELRCAPCGGTAETWSAIRALYR